MEAGEHSLNKRVTFNLILWGVGPASVALAASTTGMVQVISEAYLTITWLFGTVMSVVVVTSPWLWKYVGKVEKVVPTSIEWAELGLSMLLGVLLENMILVIFPAIYAAIKTRVDQIFEEKQIND